jgi:hypothetical protein
MQRSIVFLAPLLLFLCLPATKPQGANGMTAPQGKVYGEWRIRVRPDKGAQYDELIRSQGLPLFKAAGGRMVGWWRTQIGDLYEQLTIWEYDDMAAFQQAVEHLGLNQKFAEFAAQRDPLLSGEESRFLRLAPQAIAPKLHEPAPIVIHEIHRVRLADLSSYLEYMQTKGLPMLQQHGFSPVGPLVVDVGDSTEVTYLFRFESLAERERLIAEFSQKRASEDYSRELAARCQQVVTRLLVPAAAMRE